MAVQVQQSMTESVQSQVASELLELYRGRSPQSRARHEAACRVLPGGDTRTIAFHPPYPLAIDHGAGYHIWDADEHAYIDFLNNYTSLIHGHAHSACTDAALRQVRRGTAFPAPNHAQTRLAEILTNRVSSVDRVRFCNSGTEAVMFALRAARAFTDRDLVIKIEGGYHGTYDDVEVSVHPDLTRDAGSDDQPSLAQLNTKGVPTNTVDNVLIAPFNDASAVERLLREHPDQIAAVIVEPVMGAGGMIPATTAFLDAIRALTVEHEALLIFDEVMSFRLEPGGMQQHARVRPDLTTFAKIIGGGFPVGAFGGKAAVMDQFDPLRPTPIWQSGTFNGNAVTMVAGVAAMEIYTAAEVARINRLGDRLRDGFNALLSKRNITGVATGYGSFVALHLGTDIVFDYRSASRANKSLAQMLHIALLLEGIFCAPRLMWCISTPMNEQVIDDALAATDRAFDRIAPAMRE